ncbi:MAG: hypothetical protein WCE81_13260 [Halobacteriota archaeon]
MPDSEEIRELGTEIKELKNEVKELRLLLLYRLLKEEQRSSERIDNVVPFAKQILKMAVEKLLQPEMKDQGEEEREATKPVTKIKATSKEELNQPLVDVEREVKVLKNEMANNLRDAAREIEEGEEDDEGGGQGD